MVKRVCISLAVAIFCSLSFAGEVGRIDGNGMAVVLTDEQRACPSGMKAAAIALNGRRAVGCYLFHGDRVLLFVDNGDDDAGWLPKSAFKMRSL